MKRKKEIEKILKKLSEETAEYTEVIFEDFGHTFYP